MPGTIPTYPALLAYEVAFNANPNQATLPPFFTDVSTRTKTGAQSVTRGRQYELDVNQAGEWRTTLENKDGALDPTNTASPYAPGVVPYRACRIRAIPGVNALTVDQATAGEGTPYAGPAIPTGMNVSNDFGYPLTIAAPPFGFTAYQGSRVYQAVVPSGASQFATVLLVTNIPVIPGTAYTFSGQVLITAGTSTATNASILWFGQSGASLTPASGTSVTPTAGASAWNQIGVSGTAPSTAYSATLKIQIASGSTAAQTTWILDALQWEQSSLPTAFQVPQTVSPNLLPRAIATGTASMAATDSAATWYYPAAGSVAQATGLSPAVATGFTTALAWTTPSGTTSASPLYAGVAPASAPAGPAQDCVQVARPLPYTFSVYLMRTASADATVTVTPAINWFSPAGASLGTTTGTGALIGTGSWTRVTAVAGSAPAGAAWGRPLLYISSPSPTTAGNTIYAACWQMEQAGGAGTWYDPGPTYQAFNGLMERWPQTWLFNGTYGTVNGIGVDALAALAQYTLQAPFIEESLALGPNFLYTLADPAGSTSCTDVAGKRAAAPVENSPFGSGSLTFGNSITSTGAPGAFVGSSGPVATFNNNSSQANKQEPQTFLSLHKTTTTPGPPGGAWTRMIAFRSSSIPAAGNFPTLWAALAPFWSSDLSYYQLNINPTTGKLAFQESGASGLGPLYTSASSVCDGNWHQVAICFTGSAPAFFDVYLDGVRVFHDNNGGVGWSNVTSIATDVVGAYVVYGNNAYVLGFVGDLAHIAEFPFALSTTQASNLYNSWRSASSGESSGARMQRLLATWVGWIGPAAIDAGQTASMGPATDLAGATALDAANAIALTENGNFFASSAGALTFTSRARRYQQLNPAVVFGENAALGEWPYQDISGDFDSQHLFDWIQVTHYASGQVANAQDAGAQQAYFPRLLQRTINPLSFNEATDAANYLLQQYKGARLRVSNLTLNPSAVPGLFRTCLQLEIGTRVRVMRRPPSAPVVQFDGFIEAIQWTIDPQSGAATVQLQCSPADLSSYWLLGALHTTLHAQAASGQSQASINALPDAAYNTLAQSMPSGYQLTFDPGTSIAETMTIAPGGIPATNIGYFAPTLTFTTNFAFTHAAGATVCEPLPSGTSDPATWDAASVLGAASCQVLSGGSSGTNTITVGPLGDAKNNALNSDWNVGDLLSISPGTPQWEGYNLLRPNQASAGEGVFPLAAGSSGASMGITADLGTPTVTASATAYQGANVWQVSVAGGASTPSGLLYVLKVPAAAGLAFTASAYVRSATSGQNPTASMYIKYYNTAGSSVGQFSSGNTALTGSPTAPWTRLSASGTAPAGAVWAQLGVLLQVAPSGAWTFQADGLQVEQAASAGTFCVTPQILSVAPSVPGYSAVQITLNTNLINSHAAGDTVCDPLPPGVTAPSAVAATCRLTY